MPQIRTECSKKVYYYQAIKMRNSCPVSCQDSASFKEFDNNISNLIVKCRQITNIYPNEERFINRFSIRDVIDDQQTLSY